MRPEPISEDDSDENRTLIQDPALIYESEHSSAGRRRSFVHSARPSAPPRERDSNLPGAVLAGRYRVEQIIERSATEVVLMARHLELGEPVVVRRLTTEGAASPELVANFLAGARQALKLKGFHVERVTDLGRLDSGAPYRVSELPRGPSLDEFVLVRGALPAEDAVDLVLLACEGVAEAHARGMVHRNLSTSNVVLERHPDGAPLIKVRSFGLPDLLDGETQLGVRLRHQPAHRANALRYASPEQIRDPETVDQRTDIWALGAILYELLAGVPAYSARSSPALLAMIVADAPVSLDAYRNDLHPELEGVVFACLSKDPEERPRSVEELVRMLMPFASEQVDGVAMRITRVLVGSATPSASFGAYAMQRARSGIPALPARASGPFYGSGFPPERHSQRAYSEHAVGRASQRARERSHSKVPRSDGDGARTASASRSVLLLVGGAALGGLVTFAATTAGFRLSRTEIPKPLPTTLASTIDPRSTALATPQHSTAATVSAPVRPRRTTSGARKDADTAPPSKDQATRTEPSLKSAAPAADSDEALFDKPE